MAFVWGASHFLAHAALHGERLRHGEGLVAGSAGDVIRVSLLASGDDVDQSSAWGLQNEIVQAAEHCAK
jgi:hypothetical protein